ncbi:COMM domain-containing protein 4 isoform X3 [Cricetulus griseus]|uniref:COMM domain-containing protein 4 isoform X3 n=1 Tax=Cricetulus griseus TaxID=10029 RepID=UPI0007DA541F|nr:COMM domain-containing protein 4 isoform X3 [Cricetulus griseus]
MPSLSVVVPRLQETWGPKLKITEQGGSWGHSDTPCLTCGPLESGDVKATVAVLSFILSSAAKHSVDSDSLSSELQQLGLPRAQCQSPPATSAELHLLAEHATSLCRCYEEKQNPLQEHLRACSLRVNRLAHVGWRVDYTLSSSLLRSVEEPMVHLQLEIVPAPGALAQPISMSLSADKFQVLLAELKQAQTLMTALG